MRFINIIVIAALILAASIVYKIKFDSTLQAERVGKLASELRRERNAIATLRAEWSRLESPLRIQGLAQRHLTTLRPIVPTQFDSLERLPERPPAIARPQSGDPIGAMIAPPLPETTGSIFAPPAQR